MQRCTLRVENFGGRLAIAIFDLLAIDDSNEGRRNGRNCSPQGPKVRQRLPTAWTTQDRPCRYAAAPSSPSFFNGTPIARRNCLASSSFLADVTSVMFIPCGRVYLSGLISGKTICSESPRL